MRLEIFDKRDQTSEFFDFSNNSESADKYYAFLEKSGLSRLFKKDGIKNLVDYYIGIEVGLDSNGRKNRGGTIMEDIVETYVKDFCDGKGFNYMARATATEIKAKWNYDVKVDKSERSFDFAIYNSSNGKLKVIETNFYNSGGSKLKSVAGEFRSLFDDLSPQDIELIWVTDDY